MINFLEYVNIIAEADAPGLGPAGGSPAAPPAGGSPAAPPVGGDLGGLSSGGGLSSVPSASGGGGAGGVPSLDVGMGGAAPAGDMGALKAPNINLKDAFYYLEDFFSKNKK